MAGKPDWHKDEEIRATASSFHMRYARQPVRLDAARQTHEGIIRNLQVYLNNQQIPNRPEYVGSAYEGVKVAKNEGNDDLEFDVLVVMKLPSSWKPVIMEVPGKIGHAFLILPEAPIQTFNQRKTFFEDVLSHAEYCYIDGCKMINKFYGELQKWIDTQYQGRILLRRHGPAIQMDVYENLVTSGRPYYSVDIVATVEVEKGGKIFPYVAKPLKNKGMPDNVSWRKLSPDEVEFRGRTIDERVNEFSPLHLKCMQELEERLQQIQSNFRIRFAGHREDGSSIEFKVLVIDNSYRNEIEIEATQIVHGTRLLRLKPRVDQFPSHGLGQLLTICYPSGRGGQIQALDSRKATNLLEKQLQQCIEGSGLLNGQMHVRRNGPCVRLLLFRGRTYSDAMYLAGLQMESASSVSMTPLFCVDIILAYGVGDGLYAARPEEEYDIQSRAASKSWRQSYSVEAKIEVYGYQYGCLKMVLRMLKVLRNRNVELNALTSYHLKTIILWLKHNSTAEFWNEKYLGLRLMDALSLLETYLRQRELPHFFLRDVDLIRELSDDCIYHMHKRISSLCTSRSQMLQALQ